MKSYKDFEKRYIGDSDIAALILVGYKDNEGLVTQILNFEEDGDYRAYIVRGADVEIGTHYKKVATFNSWLKVYDDDTKILDENAGEINVYRAGMRGCIIQLID